MSARFQIGVDIDDVLHPWYTTAHRICEQVGITNGVTPVTYDPATEYGIDRRGWLEALAAATLDGSLYVTPPPITDAAEAIRRLHFEGHVIYLITSRGTGWEHSEEIKRQTEAWLHEFAIPHADVIYAADKTIPARALELDYFIDDSVDNFEALQSVGVNVYLMSAPHNLDYYTPQRVESVHEFAQMIMEEARR